MRNLLASLTLLAFTACTYDKELKATSALDSNPLRVLADPFVLQGTLYLKLSLENHTGETVVLRDINAPGLTTEKWFQVFVDGNRVVYPSLGVYSVSRTPYCEIPGGSRFFFGIATLAGDNKAGLGKNYCPYAQLTSGVHRIEVRANGAIPARFDVAVPNKIKTAPDRDVPTSLNPLQFSLVVGISQGRATVDISVANESASTFRYPYRGDIPPWHRADWYQVEIDGKLAVPHVPAVQHKDSVGQYSIPPFERRHAHTFHIQSDTCSINTDGYRAIYRVESGEHVIKVLPTSVWREYGQPTPKASIIRLQFGGSDRTRGTKAIDSSDWKTERDGQPSPERDISRPWDHMGTDMAYPF